MEKLAGAVKQLREKKGLTQAQLADMLSVSDKAVSKWETAKGLPDISLLEPLAAALGVSVSELLAGRAVTNRNRSGNMLRSQFYLCPLCGNIIRATGEASVTCCGITLPALEAQMPDEQHRVSVTAVEDEQFVTVDHPMTKQHYITFAAFVGCERVQFVKLYPESDAAFRMNMRGGGYLYICCNHHGLMRIKI